MGFFSSVKQVYDGINDRIYDRRRKQISEITEDMRVLRVRNDYMTTRKYVIKLKHDLQGLAAVAEQAPEYLVGAAEQASENPLFCGVETDSFSLNVTKQNIMAYTCELAGVDAETLSPRQLMIRLVQNGELSSLQEYLSTILKALKDVDGNLVELLQRKRF